MTKAKINHRKILSHISHYSRLLTVVSIGFLFLALVILLSQQTFVRLFGQKTQSYFPGVYTYAAGTRGIPGDKWADIVVGKPDFSEIVPGSVVANKLNIPHGVIVDRSSTANKLYVYDGGNSRVLGFDLSQCLSSPTNPLGCSTSIVLGQPDMGHAACNGDSGFQNWPNRVPASSSTLCGLQESQLSVSEGGSGTSMTTDSSGNLYITDFWNHRVLKYNSPFTSDTTADDIWGQTDFSGNKCNKGQSSPSASSLCFSWGQQNNWTAGVEVDPNDNVWVADNGNHRVLRFPAGQKTADLVLGQPDFTASNPGSGANQLSHPNAVRMDASGSAYVSDLGNNRIVVYDQPLTSGMSGRIFGNGFIRPAGIEFDPVRGGVWIDNTGHAVLERWDTQSQILLETIGKRDDQNQLGDATGSFGIDTNGNVYIAATRGNYQHDVLMYAKGQSADTPTRRFFGGGANAVTNRGIRSGRGIVVSDNQAVAADDGRILFWNNPSSLTTGASADGVIEATNFSSTVYGCCLTLKADKNHHLYTTLGISGDLPNRIHVFQLPLTSSSTPIATIAATPLPQGSNTLPLLGGGQITLVGSFFGLAPAADGSFLWLSDQEGNRVVRIRDPLTNPTVDVVLGQTSPTATTCNRGGAASSDALLDLLCYPGSLSIDKLGNLYVSDHSLEIRGNMRLLVFSKDLFPTNNTSVIYAPTATKSFPNLATWEPAFDSQNHMVAGFNPYYTGNPTANPNGGWFPGVFLNPLSPTSIVPDMYLNDYYSMAYGATFDDHDNLYISDLDRSRFLVYNQPIPAPTLTPIPTNTPIPTSTPTLTPTATPIPVDNIFPTVAIISPLANSTVPRGSNVTISATAMDNVKVAKVEFYINGVLKGTDTTAPYSHLWTVPVQKNKLYTIIATAYDTSNNKKSQSISVTSSR